MMHPSQQSMKSVRFQPDRHTEKMMIDKKLIHSLLTNSTKALQPSQPTEDTTRMKSMMSNEVSKSNPHLSVLQNAQKMHLP